MSFVTKTIGGLFKGKQVQPQVITTPPPPVATQDILTPEAQGLRKRLLSDYETRYLGPQQDSQSLQLANQRLTEELQGGPIQNSQEFANLVASLDPVYRVADQRAAEARRQQDIYYGGGGGPAREESIALERQAVERDRHASLAAQALQLAESHANRVQQGIGLASNLQNESLQRNIAAGNYGTSLLGASQLRPIQGSVDIVQPGYRPSTFESLLGAAGQAAGAYASLGGFGPVGQVAGAIGGFGRPPVGTPPIIPYRNSPASLRRPEPSPNYGGYYG